VQIEVQARVRSRAASASIGVQDRKGAIQKRKSIRLDLSYPLFLFPGMGDSLSVREKMGKIGGLST
jgi:hypothetical protein